MTRSRLASAFLLTFAPWLAGCASVGPTKISSTSAPSEATWQDRLFRRETRTPELPSSAFTEVPEKLRNPSQLSLVYARLMTESGNLPEAENHFNKVLADKPENIDAILGLAKVHHLAGRLDAAEQTYHRALRIDSHSAQGLHGLGQVYAARKRWDEAAELLNQAVLAAPNDGALHYDLAVALVHAGNVPAALPHFINTVGDAEAHYNIGLILHRQGRVDESAQHFRLALAKKPGLQQASYWLDEIERTRQTESPRAVTGSPGGLPGSIQMVAFETHGG